MKSEFNFKIYFNWNNQKAYQHITLMCDHYQYRRKVNKSGKIFKAKV